MKGLFFIVAAFNQFAGRKVQTNCQLSGARFPLAVGLFTFAVASLLMTSSADAQGCVPPPNGLVSWWSGDNGGNDEMGHNSATLQDGTAITNGLVGLAYEFDGVENYVSVGASASLNVGLGDGFTLEGWIKPSDTSAPHVIAEWNDGAGGVGVHLMHSIGSLGGLGSLFANVVDTSGGSHYFATGAGLLVTMSFQHVALTYDKSTGVARIFHNGAPMDSQNVGVITPRTGFPLNLGKRTSGGDPSYYRGLMDEFAVYDRALNNNEIQAIYNAGLLGKCKQMAPTIVVQPTGRSVRVGARATFQVYANGPSLLYQWRLDGVNISGATNASLYLTNIQTNQVGDYSVAITNLYGFAISSNAALTVSPDCVSSFPGLVSWWSAEGDALDQFSGNDGIMQGGLGFGAGKAGQAFAFDGLDDLVRIPAAASLNVGTNNGFTIEFWINPNDVSSPRPLVEWSETAGGPAGVHIWTSVPGLGEAGSIMANMVDASGGNHILATTPSLLSNSNFQHVAVSYDRLSGVTTIYYDGTIAAAQNAGSFVPNTSASLFLGRRPGSGYYFSGLMDEVTLYDRALSALDIQAIYVAGSAGKTCSPPEVLVQPQSRSVFPGSNVTFTVTARGTFVMDYQWRWNNLDILGATNTSFTVTNAQPSDAGNYSVRITNPAGTTVSSNATLKVNVITVTGNGLPLTNTVHSFSGPALIGLQNIYPNGLVFYTLDGSPPSFLSTPYTAPFVMNQNGVLRALGYSDDFFESGESDPVTILFVPLYSLTTSNYGGGNISINPPGGTYLSNTVVSLTATPDTGWVFLQWLGDASGSSPITNLTMNRQKFVQAVFGTTLSTTAAGGGSVVINPVGNLYPYGAVVTLSAIPDPGKFFGIWGNAASGNVNPLVFTVTNANRTVSSLFSVVSGGQAALTVLPVGMGQVSVSPRSNVYSLGSNVTITAMPGTGQSFVGWTGDASGTQNPLSVTMNQSKLIYATFTARPWLQGEPLASEGFRLTLTGDYPASYRLDSSSDVAAWTLLTTLTNKSGTAQFVDSTVTNVPHQFYRALKLP
jgi:hypothetical protein